MARFWRQVIIVYIGKYIVYAIGKMVRFMLFSQKPHISFGIIKMCT